MQSWQFCCSSGNNLRLKQCQVNLQEFRYSFLNLTCNTSSIARIVFFSVVQNAIYMYIVHVRDCVGWELALWCSFPENWADLEWHAYGIYAIGSSYLTCNTSMKARFVFILCTLYMRAIALYGSWHLDVSFQKAYLHWHAYSIYTIGSSSENVLFLVVTLFLLLLRSPFFSLGSIKAVSKNGETDSIRRPEIPSLFFSFPGPLM